MKKSISISVILLFLLTGIFSCYNQQNPKGNDTSKVLLNGFDESDLKQILNSKNKAVYLSFDNLQDDFGSIILLDLISKKSVKLFDNRFYNSNPIFIDNGKIVLFESAQKGNPLQLRVVKYHARRQLYFFDLNILSLRNYFEDTNELEENQIIYFTGLTWDENRKQIYFSNKDYDFYQLRDGESKPHLLQKFYKDIKIWDIDLSPNKMYLALWYDDYKEQHSGIYIYDISSGKITKDIRSKKSFTQLLGWSFDNNIYYQSDSIFVFDCNSNSSISFDLNLNKDSLMVKKIYPESNQSIILFVDHLKYLPDLKYSVSTSTEIVRYNLRSNKIEWLTNDGRKKDKLDVYIQ